MRLGIFGGSFDPPHVGHLIVAVDAYETLGLDRLVLVPAGEQPLKRGRRTAAGADRLQMVRLLVGDDRRFDVDSIEIDRGGLSYTVDTLATYAERHPDAERFFLAGADIVNTYHKWRDPERVARLARLAVLSRRDGEGSGDGVDGESGDAGPEEGRAALERVGAVFLETRRVDVSSTELRARVRQGKSVRGFVPDAIAAHIERARLYR